MRWIMYGLVVLLVAVCGSAALAKGPIDVSFETQKGEKISGRMQTWNSGTFTGTFGTFEWNQLSAPQAWHLLGQLIDENRADQWMSAARAMKNVAGGEPAARRAFEWARWLSQQMTNEAAQSLNDLPEGGMDHWPPICPGDIDAMAPPQGTNWRVNPWTYFNDVQQVYVELVTKKTQANLERLKMPLKRYENEWFLLYADLKPEEAAAWLQRLANVHRSLARIFGNPPGGNVFQGKAVVLMARTRDEFAQLCKSAPGAADVTDTAGFMTPDGPDVYVTLWNDPDRAHLEHTLAHETTHAFMWRLWSNAVFPRWFDEGFADYSSAILGNHAMLDNAHWKAVRQFVLSDGPVDAVLDLPCRHSGWPGPRQIGYGVSYYLVRFMFETNPRGAVNFVKALKLGKPWSGALREEFGMDRNALVKAFIDHMRSAPADPPAPPSPPPPADANSWNEMENILIEMMIESPQNRRP